MIDYGFELDGFLPVSKDEKDEYVIRPNFRIINCCGNCVFFWYKQGQERRGWCRLPNPELYKNQLTKTTREEAEKRWKRAHITCVCDNHQLKSEVYNISNVTDWVRRPFQLDGKLNIDEDIRQAAVRGIEKP